MGSLRQGRKERGSMPEKRHLEDSDLVKRKLAVVRSGKLVPTEIVPGKITAMHRERLYRKFNPAEVDQAIIFELRANRLLDERGAMVLAEKKLEEKALEARDREAAKRGELRNILYSKVGAPHVCGMIEAHRAIAPRDVTEADLLVRVAKHIREIEARRAQK